MDYLEARWALEYMVWEGPGRRAIEAQATEDASFDRSAEALRQLQLRQLV